MSFILQYQSPEELFNRLPRPMNFPNGVPNHWVFGIRRVPFNPPGDMVLAVHPPSRFLLFGGPDKLLSDPTTFGRAGIVIRLLLDMFFKGIAPESRGPYYPPSFAPWTWAAEDPELAAAVEERLKGNGVRKELCQMPACSAEGKQILQESYASLLKSMGIPIEKISQAYRWCHGCEQIRVNFSASLNMCSACEKAWYRSQDYRRKRLDNRPAPAPEELK